MSTRIIAEVAQGYEGNPDYCIRYIEAAEKSGADAVKFQIVYADDVADPSYEYYNWFKQLEMDLSVWEEVREKARTHNIPFFTDVSGERAMAIAEKIQPDAIKLHASNFFNRTLIEQAFVNADRVFISTGGIEAGEISDLIKEITTWNTNTKLVLLCGFQAEPTPTENAMLRRITALKDSYPDVEVGFLDHTEGVSPDRIHVSAMALALRADWIEKHMTLERKLKLEDFVSALEPQEFAEYTTTLARLGKALGLNSLSLTEPERVYRDKAVKKVLAAHALSVGHVIKSDDVLLKRTSRASVFEGYHNPDKVIGSTIKTSLESGDVILKEHLE